MAEHEPGQTARDAFQVRPDRREAEEAVRTLLRWAHDDPRREGLVDTPARVAKAYDQLFGGYREDPHAFLRRVFEEVEGYSDMVLVRDIPFHSHCERYMLPFVGVAHIAYYPTGGVVGLSKFARVVDTFARRLQNPEALTTQIVQVIESVLRPRGVAVMLDVRHLGEAMLGGREAWASSVTTEFTGVFKDDPIEEARFMVLVAPQQLDGGHLPIAPQDRSTL